MDRKEDINWTLKEMRALHHVVQLRTVTAAAERMGLSQPSVSRLLSSLEGKLSEPLFERQGRNLVPTRSALEFHEASIRVFEAIENMGKEPIIARGAQSLHIMAPPSFTQGFLQEAVARFQETNSAVAVQIDVCSSPTIFNVISEGGADLGITDAIVKHEALRYTPFRSAKMVCFMRTDHVWAKLKEVSFETGQNLSVIGLTRRHPTRSVVDRILQNAGIDWRMIVETSTAASAISFVRETGAVAFLSPFPVAINLPEDVTFRPLHSDLEYTTRFVYPATIGTKSLTRFFMRLIKELSKKHDAWSDAV